MSQSIKLNVFGRLILAIQTGEGWSIFYLSGEGKRRPANDIIVPAFVNESEIESYLDDLCHEWATEKYPEVQRLN